jgi:hypothetical protein
MGWSNAATRAVRATVFLFLLVGISASGAWANTSIPDRLDVVGGNSSNSRLFWLNYDMDDPLVNEAIQVNTAADASARPSLNSFAFFQNTCGPKRTDVIAAATNSNELVLYRGGRGTGETICPGAGCPARPDGLSTSVEQLVSAVTTGAGGSTPAVWVFKPGAACSEGAEKASFSLHGGGRFNIAGARVSRIADTEFVPADGGNLVAGDLLVLTSSPAMISRVTKAQVAALPLATGPAAELPGAPILPAGFFGKATPTGMAFVPGDGGATSPALLVTLDAGRVLELRFSGGQLSLVGGATSWPSYELSGSAGVFSNPRGIAAGTRGAETYMVVAEQNQGRYIRAPLESHPANPGRLAIPANSFRSIVSSVGSPQGVAINPDDDTVSVASDCVDFDPGEGDTGCILAGAIQVHLSQGYLGLIPPGARVTARLRLVEDTRNGADIPLQLPGFPANQDYFVPASCRGFNASLSANGYPQLVLLNMGLNFNIPPGNFIQVTERVMQLLGLEQDCQETGARIYHHPTTPGGGTLFDTTFSCQNPSRSVEENFSPIVFCTDQLHLARNAAPSPLDGIELNRSVVNDEIRRRLEVLRAIVAELRATTQFAELGKQLNDYVTGQANPQSSWPQLRYIDASKMAEDGALAVFNNKHLFTDPANATVLPPDTYARLLGRLLALAFYNSETGALVPYQPHPAFCQFGSGSYPELPDVECRTAP